jgi:hypothetical protein
MCFWINRQLGIPMEKQALKEAAIELRKQLELYKEKESAARRLYAEMENLISAAERGEINTQIEARDIPGHRIMDESNLRGYRELSAAYSKFYVGLIDGRDSDTLKMIQKIMEQVRA